jgi:hypothetical protein
MERKPEFEDDNIRSWKADKSEHTEHDRTTMDVDLAREEIFESRTYTVQREALAALALAAAIEHPEMDVDEFLAAFLVGSDATMKLLAKQDRGNKSITSILVGTFAGERILLERWEGLEELEFRTRVEQMDETMVTRGRFEPPLVVTLEQWRVYEDQQRPEPGSP